jgi:hypothetical protein
MAFHVKTQNGEKRKARRFKQWNKALIRSASGEREFFDSAGINAYTVDISLQGAKIQSEVSFPIGTVVRIQIDLSRSKETISVEGEVKWIARNTRDGYYEFGLEFLQLFPRAHLALLKNLFDENAGIPTRIN